LLDIVITLIFSVAMLVFMAFPAMKIVDWVHTKKELTEKQHNVYQVLLTILLSLAIGLFLKFA